MIICQIKIRMSLKDQLNLVKEQNEMNYDTLEGNDMDLLRTDFQLFNAIPSRYLWTGILSSVD